MYKLVVALILFCSVILFASPTKLEVKAKSPQVTKSYEALSFHCVFVNKIEFVLINEDVSCKAKLISCHKLKDYDRSIKNEFYTCALFYATNKPPKSFNLMVKNITRLNHKDPYRIRWKSPRVYPVKRE